MYTYHQALGACPVTSTKVLSITQKIASISTDTRKKQVSLANQEQKPQEEAKVHLVTIAVVEALHLVIFHCLSHLQSLACLGGESSDTQRRGGIH